MVASSVTTPLCAQCQLLESLDHQGASTDRLGFCVAVTGDAVVVAAPFKDAPLAYNAGSLFVLERIGVRWSQTELRMPDPVSGEGLGWSLAADTENVYAHWRRTIVVWNRSENGWEVAGSIIPDGPPVNDGFPGAISADDERVIGGAWLASRAFVFEKLIGGGWRQVAQLVPSQGGWYFGYSVAIHGDVAVVGAPNDFTQGDYAGAAFVFERNETGSWIETARLLPIAGSLQNFGCAVAAGENMLLIGAMNDNTQAPSAGSVYAYERDAAGIWVNTQRLFAVHPRNSDFFGVSVALDGDFAIVGAENVDGVYFGYGAAFVFQRGTDGIWRHLSALMADDPEDGSEFGRSVAIRGDLAVVGAPFLDDEGIEDRGAAYVFAVGPDADADGVMDICECRAAGDLSLDGVIDIQDLVIVLSCFSADAGGDIDSDGDTDLQDLAYLLANFGSACP